MRKGILSLLLGILCIATPVGAGAQDHALWEAADIAYSAGNVDDGHALLKQLIDARPGDVDLAIECLGRILGAAGRVDTGDPWVAFAVERLTALERIGALPANSARAAQVHRVRIDLSLRDQPLELIEDLDRLVEENPHQISWQLQRARSHQLIDSVRARPLYEELKRKADPGHPDPVVREMWASFATELERDTGTLPQPIFDPLPGASPLVDADPDDPDGRWRKVSDSSPLDVAAEIDRLAGEALEEDQVVPWRDMGGLLDPVRALDLHLLSKPPAQLDELRLEQQDSFSFEEIPDAPDEAETLALSRRFPWSLSSQQLLLKQSHKYIWEGRAESARRCFLDLLTHTEDQDLLDASQVGLWVVAAQVGKIDQLVASTDAVDPEKEFPWNGQTATAGEIQKHLVEPRVKNPPPIDTVGLADLKQVVVHLPAVPPWPTDQLSNGVGVDLDVVGTQLIASGRNLLASYDIATGGTPSWSQVQRGPIENQKHTGYRPGYFRPLLTPDGKSLFNRWGFGSLPDGIAAFERATGTPLWASRSPEQGSGGYRFNIPMGDPVFSDGKLFFLQWSTRGNVNDARGRTLRLVCFDPQSRAPIWESTVAESGRNSDLVGNLERANPSAAVYGNRVTVHDGAIYSCSDAGLVSRSDVRDGRTDWIHYYRRNSHLGSAESLGCQPVIAGDKLICMPRDTSRVFALSLETGRLLWDNPLVGGVECFGPTGDRLIVRGTDSLTGVDVSNGEAIWYLPLESPIIGRAQLLGETLYFAQRDRLNVIDAPSGKRLGSRAWELGDQRALAFRVSGDRLLVVSDEPADDPTHRVAQPLAPQVESAGTGLRLPLRNTWSLHRAEASVALPKPGSPLAGRAFVLSGGILECIDLSPQGGIRWQRFVNSKGASLHLAGDRLLLVEGRRGSSPTKRVLAFEAADGHVLWDRSVIPHQLGNTMTCGARMLFFDNNSGIAALDLDTGKRLWQRHFGTGQVLRVNWDGSKLQAFHTTLRRGARHFELSLETGETLADHGVEVKMVEGVATNGKLIEGGFFEVRFEPVKGRFVRLSTLSEINGREWASAAELQLVGADGERLARDGWKATTDSYETQSTRYRPSADKAIDGDPTSWWHSQWLDGIPDHPHHVAIDMGSVQTVAGLQYLPAVIVNNNGMIRDYQIQVSADGQDWGEPVAQGVMVNRVPIERAFFAGGDAMFLESRDHRKRVNSVFRYGLDGQDSNVVAENARILHVTGRYAIASIRKNDKDQLVVFDATDPDYRFELGEQAPPNRGGEIYIQDDQLILADREIVVADLKDRRFVRTRDDPKARHNQHGQVVRVGTGSLLKFVHRGHNGQELTRIDLETGEVSGGVLDETDQQQLSKLNQEPRRLEGATRKLIAFEDVLLFYDGSVLRAWVGVAD